MLAVEQVKSEIENAFLPLRCDASVNTYERVIGFKVVGPNDETIEHMPRLNITLAKNEPILHATLSVARERIEDKGYSLTPWQRHSG